MLAPVHTEKSFRLFVSPELLANLDDVGQIRSARPRKPPQSDTEDSLPKRSYDWSFGSVPGFTRRTLVQA